MRNHITDIQIWETLGIYKMYSKHALMLQDVFHSWKSVSAAFLSASMTLSGSEVISSYLPLSWSLNLSAEAFYIQYKGE